MGYILETYAGHITGKLFDKRTPQALLFLNKSQRNFFRQQLIFRIVEKKNENSGSYGKKIYSAEKSEN